MNGSGHKIQIFTRWLLLAGVMSGLFFSSGEGIQLFPFPGDPEKSEKSSGLSQNGKLKSYSFSVHHSGMHSPAGKNKIQKNQKFFDSAVIFGRELWPSKFFCVAHEKGDHETELSSALNFSALPSNRAPPVV